MLWLKNTVGEISQESCRNPHNLFNFCQSVTVICKGLRKLYKNCTDSQWQQARIELFLIVNMCGGDQERYNKECYSRLQKDMSFKDMTRAQDKRSGCVEE